MIVGSIARPALLVGLARGAVVSKPLPAGVVDAGADAPPTQPAIMPASAMHAARRANVARLFIVSGYAASMSHDVARPPMTSDVVPVSFVVPSARGAAPFPFRAGYPWGECYVGACREMAGFHARAGGPLVADMPAGASIWRLTLPLRISGTQ